MRTIDPQASMASNSDIGRRWLLMLRTAFTSSTEARATRRRRNRKVTVLRNARDEPGPCRGFVLGQRGSKGLPHCYGGGRRGRATDARPCLCDGRRSKAGDGGSRVCCMAVAPERGVHKALDARHLDAARAAARPGCGTGKFALKRFCSSPISKGCGVGVTARSTSRSELC